MSKYNVSINQLLKCTNTLLELHANSGTDKNYSSTQFHSVHEIMVLIFCRRESLGPSYRSVNSLNYTYTTLPLYIDNVTYIL